MQVKKLLVVYHSQSGTNERLVAAAAQAATQEEGVEVRLRRAMAASVDDLLWCDGVIFCTPENLGYLAGGMKDFFDRTFYPAEPHQLNLPYMVIIGTGNDGSNALRQLQRIMTGYRFRQVAEALIIRGLPGDEDVERARELGLTMAAGLAMGIF